MPWQKRPGAVNAVAHRRPELPRVFRYLLPALEAVEFETAPGTVCVKSDKVVIAVLDDAETALVFCRLGHHAIDCLDILRPLGYG